MMQNPGGITAFVHWPFFSRFVAPMSGLWYGSAQARWPVAVVLGCCYRKHSSQEWKFSVLLWSCAHCSDTRGSIGCCGVLDDILKGSDGWAWFLVAGVGDGAAEARGREGGSEAGEGEGDDLGLVLPTVVGDDLSLSVLSGLVSFGRFPRCGAPGINIMGLHTFLEIFWCC